MKIRLHLVVLMILLSLQFSYSQKRTCGKDEKMNEIMSNPLLKKDFENRQSKFEKEYNKILNELVLTGRLTPNATINIPVAVHFPSVSSSTSSANKDCLRALAQSQIDIINADYKAVNSDISNWSSASAFYPGVNIGSIDINFQISNQNHPAGTGLTDGMLAVTFGTDFLNGADSDFTWSGYMNFVVRDEGNQTLGYSPYPGSPAGGETVVMNTFCFGSGAGCVVDGVSYVPQAPFNLGRTVTHELGHFFNLNHTFASTSCTTGSSNCNIEGDGVCDTPRLVNESYDCPGPGTVNACGTLKSLTMNYMDYVDDPCMYMFTQGQAARMLAQLNVIASEFNQNTLSSDTFITTPIFSIHPNPNNGSFSINFDDDDLENYVSIYDITGRSVYENNFLNNGSSVYLKLENLNKGVFSVVVRNNKGISTRRIIIK